jgi:hypothetical protein
MSGASAGRHGFRDRCRSEAAAWKATTPTLPDAARQPARYVDSAGQPRGALVDHCLPAESARYNLLPDVRDGARELFDHLDIPWHNGVDGGPSNHLLDSQVQCVNALFRLVADAQRVQHAFGAVLDIDEVLPIEEGRFLTFEYIGEDDVLRESPGRPRRRGTMATSCDAAFLYRTSTGTTELALVEWKFTEEYRQKRSAQPAKDVTRRRRYAHLVEDSTGPLRGSLLPFDDLLDEPFYQLMRQQLLADQFERRRSHGADVVRVVHVLPPENDAYQASLVRKSHSALGDTVDDVWRQLLRRPDRFLHVDASTFTDPTVTSAEYAARYRPATAAVTGTTTGRDPS